LSDSPPAASQETKKGKSDDDCMEPVSHDTDFQNFCKKASHFLANLYEIYDTFQGVVISPHKESQILGKKSPTFSAWVKGLSRKVNRILFFLRRSFGKG
jgi:hypothetical protein